MSTGASAALKSKANIGSYGARGIALKPETFDLSR